MALLPLQGGGREGDGVVAARSEAFTPSPPRALLLKGRERQPRGDPDDYFFRISLPNHLVEMVAAVPSAFMSSSALSILPISAVSSLRTPTP